MSRKKLREAFVKLSLKVAKATGWDAVQALGPALANAVLTIFDTSIGKIVATRLDILDGNRNKYIFS